ncbi:MAG: response regulator [Vicinamibacterales bacterium]
MERDSSGNEMRPNVLIVDDSAMMRMMVKRVAALAEVPMGSVFEAPNGEEALRVLQEHRVHVVFTDINMPVMNGVELLRRMAERPEWASIVRVVISTDGSDARREEVQPYHVSMYLQKPFQPEVMRDVLLSVHPPVDEGPALVPTDDPLLPEAVTEVLEQSFFAYAEPIDVTLASEQFQARAADGATWWSTHVDFVGPFGGRVSIRVPDSLARQLHASFAGLMPDEASSEQDVTDMMRELTNMICGLWLTKAWHASKFDLSAPIATVADHQESRLGDAERLILVNDEPLVVVAHAERAA